MCINNTESQNEWDFLSVVLVLLVYLKQIYLKIMDFYLIYKSLILPRITACKIAKLSLLLKRYLSNIYFVN